MGILQSLFGPRRPTLRREDIPDVGEEVTSVDKVMNLIAWFIKNEPFVTALSNPGCNAIFNEGYRPAASPYNDPEFLMPDLAIVSLQQWFIARVLVDLTYLKRVSKDGFAVFMEMLEADTLERMRSIDRICRQYGLELEPFIYAKEIRKITDEHDRETFKVC